MTGAGQKKGALLKFAGCVLASLGLINVLFALKSGSSPDDLFFAISAIGALALGAGLWRARA